MVFYGERKTVRLNSVKRTEVEISTDELEPVEKIIDECNCYTRTMANSMIYQLLKAHPTVQSNFWNEIQKLAKLYAENSHVDGRNKKATKFAEEIAKIPINLDY